MSFAEPSNHGVKRVLPDDPILTVKDLLGEKKFAEVTRLINTPKDERDAERAQAIDQELRAAAQREVANIVKSASVPSLTSLIRGLESGPDEARYKMKNFSLADPRVDPATRYVFHRLENGAGIDAIAAELKRTHSFVRYRIKRLALLFAVAGITVPEFLAPRSPRFTPYQRALYTEAVLAAERLLQQARDDRLRGDCDEGT